MRILITSFLMLLITFAWAKPLTAHVARQQVNADETIMLTLSGSVLANQAVDTHALEQNFMIRGQYQTSQVQIFNGKREENYQVQISLLAKHTGRLTIPSLQVGSEKTPALSIVVMPAAKTTPSSALQLQINMDLKEAYIGQQIPYIVKVLTSVPIADAELQPPTATQADIVPLDKTARYQKLINGRQFQVIEKHFTITPQVAGQLTINGPRLIAEVVQTPSRHSDIFNTFLNAKTKNRQLHGKSMTIPIQKPPIATVANKMTLTQNWLPQVQPFKVGKAISRTLTLTGQGIRAEQLPTLSMPAIVGAKIYPGKTTLSTSESAQGFDSKKQITFAIIPTDAGELTLPAIRIDWWDPIQHQVQTTQLPAMNTHVIAATPSPTLSQDEQTQATAPVVTTSTASIWPWISLALGLIWLLTLFILFRQRIKKLKTSPHHFQQQLQQACEQQDAHAAVHYLLAWSRHHWPKQSFQHSQDLFALSEEATWQQALQALQACLYGKQKQFPVSITALFLNILANKPVRGKMSSRDLPPLYPD